MRLSESAEEVATFFAKMLDHEYTTKEIFRKNFFKDWRKVTAHLIYHSVCPGNGLKLRLKFSLGSVKTFVCFFFFWFRTGNDLGGEVENL